MTEAVVTTTVAEGRADAQVVTQENFKEFVDEKLGVNTVDDEPTDANDDPEAVAAAEHAEQERLRAEEAAKANAPKEGDEDGNKVFFKGKWVGKNDFSYRLHKKEEEVNSAAQAKIEAAAAEAREAKEALEAERKRATELKAKYEPDPPADLGPEPDPAKYGPDEMDKFRKDLKEWTAETTKREIAAENAKVEQAKQQEIRAKTWKERVSAATTEIPDYAEKINAATDVKLSDQARDAIFESDAGPKLLYHFATHPEAAEALGKLTVGGMLREIGRLEEKLGGPAKPETKSAPTAKVAEISKAPAPITPLKAGNSASGLKVDSKGEWIGSYEEFKAADLAGKFR